MKVIVGLGSCGIAAGGMKVYDKLYELIENTPGMEVSLSSTGCMGMCFAEPLVEVQDEHGSAVYGLLDEKSAVEVFQAHIVEGNPLEKYIVKSETASCADDTFFNKQVRIVLARCGAIDPENLEDALAMDAYKGLEKALTMKPAEVVNEVLHSGLKGRGGAGFPTGLKWKFALNSQADQKYMICNADEGDPGAFMDRSVLEGDPHSVLEGMIIGGYAIGATEGVIYARAEYPIAVKRLEIAIRQAEERGFLGKNIFGSGFDFHVKVMQGAGAFVCGEETALMASVEGQRGMPRIRPPFPAEKGLFGKPSNINNVETLANIGWILRNGAKEFAKYGTEKSKGTKVFALAGKIKRGGLVEVPIGMTIREVIYDIGGGSSSGKPVKAVQLGGPSGGCIPERLFDTLIDYDTLAATGAIMGSGGMIVMDDDNCMVDIARYFLDFTQNESCGKCTFCRVGTKRMLEILTRITEGKGSDSDIVKLEILAQQVRTNSLCGLGQTAPNPVLTTLRYYRNEYEAHIHEQKCPSLQCRSLISYRIDPVLCTGCTICARNCPVHCISGEVRKTHVIDQEICTRCGTCKAVCRFGAVIVE